MTNNLEITGMDFDVPNNGFQREIPKILRYPVSSIKNNVSDEVYIKFLIDEEGKMSQIHAANYADKNLTKEGIRIISSINKLWQPALCNSEKIQVWHFAKISFYTNFIYKSH